MRESEKRGESDPCGGRGRDMTDIRTMERESPEREWHMCARECVAIPKSPNMYVNDHIPQVKGAWHASRRVQCVRTQ